ncbi:MAG: translocation/assembly module TamB, partial [Muribaculaceae bacterium]|nr:translocation/assembly module TamB [Muribaculaceae bacterium]
SIPSLKKEDQTSARYSRVTTEEVSNDFTCQFTINETEKWADALHLPVSILGSGQIVGAVNGDTGNLSLMVDLPYLRQGNKLIEKTQLQATVESRDSTSSLSFTTNFPTQHGPLALNFSSRALNDRIYSNLKWNIDRAARYDGHLSATTKLERYSHDLFTTINIHPGALTFNDSTWTVNNASVTISPDLITIKGLDAHRSGQFVKIDGRISPDPQDVVTVDLLGVNLDYIFESLGIDKVMLGGDATGCFYASNLMSKEPHLLTDCLSVRDISYNKVILGDAVIKSHWDPENRAITLDALVEQANGLNTNIDGAIFPLNDSLDITFDAHDVNVGFMYPYMSAFAAEVSGRASGKARLWGNFKYIDMEGDIITDNVGIKIAFTNTTYTTSDTIRLRLGEITLKNLEIKDMYGNRGVLDGKVWHKYFKEPVFDFTVKDVHNMLVYDESSRNNPDWYGKIFADGSAHVDGKPGVVNIGVNMSTAPGSDFTFVLNDMEEASDYSFITFRDRDALELGENEHFIDTIPSTVRRLKELLSHREEETSSAYNIDLVMDINPNARIDLVMDPVGGDRIRSWGNGNLRMTYGSSDNELHMYGSYTLDKGNYNFTLQDIIIKNFTIKSGSSISFTGDPFAAMLDIKAIYALNANLSDLDESFLQDKDLNRTNVPVHAVLQVTGPLNQPDIGFDLEFPTLTQDTYRKVRSIVSTDDMMNRQIIYLLALNRFYTPDYMSSTNRGNELMSVASSTISSQLGNILGSLSDKWNIAPNFRSEREDFSDVEVDVALSSSLLNNRLLFNGNFGYRDKSLNSTQFVGDFDIEYLLNRSGSLRLKAYNRYNDQNYYVRTADTTQGVGVSFRRNFDTFSDLLKSFHRRKKERKQTTGK